MRILFATPAYWPALAFGGPIWMARELCDGFARRGHDVDVVTTSILDLERERTFRARRREVEGVRVHYLATPVRYRWMGITPGLPLWLARRPRPDVVHVFGFRDVVTTTVAAWCRVRRVPYVFEGLGMFLPRIRKIRLKRAFDSSVARHVPLGAGAIVATSEWERRQMIQAGAPAARIAIRGNGFPPPNPNGSGRLRSLLGLGREPLVLYVGRIAAGKGVDLLVDAMRDVPEAHVALVGPDDGHGVIDAVRAAERHPATAGRIHRLEPQERPLELYGDADVFVLPSAGESFGMVAAEAAAAGTPVVVAETCGVAEFLGDEGAVVVPYDRDAIAGAVKRVLADGELRERLRRGGLEAAERFSWDVMVERQLEIYRDVLARG